MLFYQILPYNLHGKIKEGHTKIINLNNSFNMELRI